MQFRSTVLSAALLAVSATASPSSAHLLAKRCSPARDPDLPHGYYPPAPCWQDFDTACRAYKREGTDYLIDSKHNLTVIYGVSEYCAAEIKEELARTADGRKNYGWVKKYGKLDYLGSGILVVSNMPTTAVTGFQNLPPSMPGYPSPAV
ncbi:hypothetical protein B0H63DRAFT_474564 [Podospora didyma]|uniref:Ecp2 effector protein domain-containing protein n=1 Tax=Podospora didyma TaxID=330526 RepID=A0AAE0TV78_9PEZI|nr:hypothetical protein B0H63DRAFT_474564 [Podospora didyma]